MARPSDPYTQEQIDDALTAVIAYAGNINAARRYLKAHGKRCPAQGALSEWTRTIHWERFEELREKFSQRREDTLANNYLDAAAYATETAMLAIEQSEKRLKAGKDQDPARTAANLAAVAQKTTDKRLALQGRPSQITENREVEPLLRALVARGILSPPEEPKQIEGSDDQ